MGLHGMQGDAHLNRNDFAAAPLARICLVFGLLLAFAPLASLGADRADAKARNFQPVKKTKQTLVFEPRGLDARTVRKARLKVRVGGKRVRAKVRTRKVRRAIRRESTVRFRRRALRKKGRVRGVLRIRHAGDGRDGSGKAANVACTLGAFSATTMPGACWLPYGPQSPFNRPLPANPKLAAGSAAIIDRWAAQPDSNMFKFAGGEADTRNDYDHPVYFNSPSDPSYTIRCRRWSSSCEVDGLSVRIPGRARAAQGSDGHLSVVDQASGWEYDLWESEDLPRGGGTLYVGHGGRTMIDGDGLGSNATAAHFGSLAGIIRPEELAAGEIRHALFLVVECTNASAVYPAGSGTGRSCSEIGKSNSGAPAMGQQLYLDLSAAQIAALAAPAWQKTVLRAMADYGLFVGDTGGGSLKTLSGASYTSFGYDDPWVELGRGLDGVESWHSSSDNKRKFLFDLSETVNWRSKLRVVAPCVSAGSC